MSQDSTSQTQLEEALDTLHRQLADADQLAPEQVARLHTAMDEIREVLDHQKTPEPSLQDRLRASARHFEDSHPTLTNTLGRIADALAQLGI